MAPSAFTDNPFQLPRLRATIKGTEGAFWDVKFYPYNVSPEDPVVFAIVGNYALYICRASVQEESGVTFLAVYAKPESRRGDHETLNSCAWCFVDEEQPLIALAGENGQIQILSSRDGDLFTTLAGHGLGTVNDLATHPLYPWIVASASMDSSIRIWDLRRAGKGDKSHANLGQESVCIIICGHAQAHKEGILTVGWHERGRYLISGGFDHRICVWTIPDLAPESHFWWEISKEGRTRSSDEVRVIHYPHFISSAIHSDYVDKATFFGDLILSKACGVKENKVVLWGITGFNSRQPPPPTASAPKSCDFLETRNGFMRRARQSGDDSDQVAIDPRFDGLPPYERYLEFYNPFCPSFYVRFGLLLPSPLYPTLHPILTVGNTTSQLRHWDLQRFVVGHDGGTENRTEASDAATTTAPRVKKTKKGLARIVSRDRLPSPSTWQGHAKAHEPRSPSSSMRSSSVVAPSDANVREPSTEATSLTSETLRRGNDAVAADRQRYTLSDPYKRLQPHKLMDLPDFKRESTYFTSRAADWSPCGRWCIMVGESQGTGVITIMDRFLAQ